MAITARTKDWLLDSDPALRWQVERDLLGEPERVWQATRRRVATEGLGAALLAHQDADGQWAGGAHFPGGYFETEEARQPIQPWTATSWSLNQLREWGVEASALGDTAERLARNCRWEYEDLPFWGGEVDVCINAFTLANGAWLGVDVSELARWFPAHQLDDGGWNCEAEEGDSVRSSFHSTLNALRGMLSYERLTGDDSLREARLRGEEYLLRRRLLYRESTGKLVGPFVSHFVYPSRHQYSALTALDHFRDARLHEGGASDPRITDALDLVRRSRQDDGTWLQGAALPGRTWFPVDAEEGAPSRWLTLIGTRVLDGADGR
ncbi:squalene cyclase [Microbacterium oxydans]|uniref:squalene cyclase n=1 Tax=Microbacterium oxydans TaxID=82380 RepID=UPI0037C601DC